MEVTKLQNPVPVVVSLESSNGRGNVYTGFIMKKTTILEERRIKLRGNLEMKVVAFKTI
jgi:hypothetical protein